MGLVDFLEQYKTTDSKNVTHTSMKGGKWNIPPKKYKEFYDYWYKSEERILFQ